ncbi:elongation factor P--(R)-beta-lysine ligase [Thalassomonas sp. M1454]|uniref:elongation factor P--(R)-beta-lysine ligase n=1 Tax=Thalassomonas sp. M1454 TaxID=2594477 RepID=UPI00118053CE|nr:elongation factor P--(R)-beta-lysine ligase [Thalassomonas sp. M1454]TRX53156.1 elongation factor P--(R)-beta-lysine ligase [Thalassomonas sp. M1454]
MSWQPSASISNLKSRAAILAKIRKFFAEKDVLEVDTQAMSSATVSDLHLVSFETRFNDAGASAQSGKTLYLQTSPEYAMKRLLAAGSGPIYQICKAFRNEESGRYHNPEFTMLEWYRPGFDHFKLMAELSDLMQLILNCEKAESFSYQQAFMQFTGVDPLTSSLEELKQLILARNLSADWAQTETNKDTLLQYIFMELVETNIGKQAPCFIYNFPASQASLAKISSVDERVAERFELYYQGMELANGFHELTDATEQLKRFQADNKLRLENDLPEKAIDQNLISALESGIPTCAGVALGIDRLVMIAVKAEKISDVIAFPVNRA